MATPVEAVDQRTGRVIAWFVGILAVIALVGYMVLVAIMLTKPSDQVSAYALAVAGVGPFVGVLIGALANALTTRSGGSVDDLGRVVDMTHVPGSSESMTAGVIPGVTTTT